MFEGERKFGRTIFIEHLKNDIRKIQLTFIRYLNCRNNAKKIIGFKNHGNKEDMFQIMLQSLTDFTISNSECNIYYETTEG